MPAKGTQAADWAEDGMSHTVTSVEHFPDGVFRLRAQDETPVGVHMTVITDPHGDWTRACDEPPAPQSRSVIPKC